MKETFDSVSEEAENDLPDVVEVPITDVFDLHSIPPRDVKRVVEEYLTEARKKGFRSVRIIHGKGSGVQRAVVRGVLAQATFVRGWTDCPPQSGGWGATVAHFAQPDQL
jgi:dsDNA-specific endonuclease/ATPase MutS2